jgi:RNA polymerase sigma factor (sigma-70 family)
MPVQSDPSSSDPDEALLARYASGELAAARELTRRLAPMVLNLGMRMLGDQGDAEDVTQEAFLRLWQYASTWRGGEAKVSTWLYRVAVNLCTDRLRRQRPLAWPEKFDPPDATAGVLDKMQERQRAAMLQWALSRLPERQRQAVALRHLEDMTNPQIAEILGVSVEAVESLLARGRRALKDMLRRKGEGGGFDD